ncbi:MAG: hypothetical protein ACJ8AO_22155 [Gemmatimonadaceae bacterium]
MSAALLAAPAAAQAGQQAPQPAQPAQSAQPAQAPQPAQPMMPVFPELPVPPVPPDPPTPLPPGFEAISTQPPFTGFGPPPALVGGVALMFFLTVIIVAVGIPLVRALSRKWERQATSPGVPPEVERRLERIEQAVEAIAVEVERVGEGQRFTNQIVAELRGLPSGAAAAAERALLDRAAAPRDRVR